MTANTDARMAAARANALLHWLRPAESQFSDYSEIANFYGVTKAAVSKSLLNLKDAVGCRLPVGKRNGSRATYSRAQKAAVTDGRHASCARKVRQAR
jgi:hypothetical protein